MYIYDKTTIYKFVISTVSNHNDKNNLHLRDYYIMPLCIFLVLCRQFLWSTVHIHTYIPQPGDCSKIIECTRRGEGIKMLVLHCPLGLFWDPTSQQCSDPKDVTCFDGKLYYCGCRLYSDLLHFVVLK